jgi:hypothetical protein
LADLLIPLLQSAHDDNGAKFRLHMLNARAENGVLLPDVVGLHPAPEYRFRIDLWYDMT